MLFSLTLSFDPLLFILAYSLGLANNGTVVCHRRLPQSFPPPLSPLNPLLRSRRFRLLSRCLPRLFVRSFVRLSHSLSLSDGASVGLPSRESSSSGTTRRLDGGVVPRRIRTRRREIETEETDREWRRGGGGTPVAAAAATTTTTTTDPVLIAFFVFSSFLVPSFPTLFTIPRSLFLPFFYYPRFGKLIPFFFSSIYSFPILVALVYTRIEARYYCIIVYYRPPPPIGSTERARALTLGRDTVNSRAERNARRFFTVTIPPTIYPSR